MWNVSRMAWQYRKTKSRCNDDPTSTHEYAEIKAYNTMYLATAHNYSLQNLYVILQSSRLLESNHGVNLTIQERMKGPLVNQHKPMKKK